MELSDKARIEGVRIVLNRHRLGPIGTLTLSSLELADPARIRRTIGTALGFLALALSIAALRSTKSASTPRWPAPIGRPPYA